MRTLDITTGPDPRTIVLDDEMASAVDAAFALQAEAFERKFGRKPGPNDPIFFNPEADEPEPMTERQMLDMQAVMEEHGFNEQARASRETLLEERGLILRPGDRGYRGPPESPRKARDRRKRNKRRR